MTLFPANSSVLAPSDGPIVIKIGSQAASDPASAWTLWASIAQLASEHAAGIVVVHGGGKAVDRMLARLGMTTEREQGLRITPPEQMEVIAGVLAGSVNKKIVGCLAQAGMRPVGLSLGDGGLAKARVLSDVGFDPGRVGEITGGDPAVLHALLNTGCTPVLSSVAIDDAGDALNVNADDAASAIASIVRAKTLLFLTATDGVLTPEGKTIESLTADDAEEMILSGQIAGGMIPKVRASRRAASSGVRVIIGPWREHADGALLAAQGNAGSLAQA